jgi:hypothetical protein
MLSGERVLAGKGSFKWTGDQCLLSAQDRERFSASTSLGWHRPSQWQGWCQPKDKVGGRSRLGWTLACNRSTVVSAFAKRRAGFSDNLGKIPRSQRLRALELGRLQASAAP